MTTTNHSNTCPVKKSERVERIIELNLELKKKGITQSRKNVLQELILKYGVMTDQQYLNAKATIAYHMAKYRKDK